MWDRDWVLLGIGAVVALMALPVVCSGEPSPPGTVLLAGDSLMWQSRPAVDRALRDDGWDVQTWAVPGAGITGGGSPVVDWPTRMEELVDEHEPEIVVIELGTNGCGPECTSIPEAIDAVMEPVEDVSVVLWLDVREEAPRPPERAEINEELRRATDRWDNLTVMSFDEWFRGHPEFLAEDGVHLSSRGQQVVATRVRAEIREHADVDTE
jgi:lysophospholipase L1-like esterase